MRDCGRGKGQGRERDSESGERGGEIKFLALDLVTREIMWCEAVGCLEVKESGLLGLDSPRM